MSIGRCLARALGLVAVSVATGIGLYGLADAQLQLINVESPLEESLFVAGLEFIEANGVHVCQGVGNSGHDDDPATTTMIPPADACPAISTPTARSTRPTCSRCWRTGRRPDARPRETHPC